MIFRRGNSISSVLGSAEQSLVRGDASRALECVRDLVEDVVTEPLCTAMVFASSRLDAFCQRIGEFSLQHAREAYLGAWPDRGGRPLVVYVVTRLQRSGGHSRVVDDFIRAQPEKDHLILATGIAGASDHPLLDSARSGGGNVRFVSAPRGNLYSRLVWLQGMLMGCGAEHVYLLNNHNDSVAVAAFHPALGLRASYYHHGDHHLCLGVHLKHLVHIDPHPMGFHNCRDSLGVDNIYVPLTFEDRGARERDVPSGGGGGLCTATAARFNKIEIPYYVSYVDVIPGVLKATGGRHLHIGRLSPWALRRVRQGLRREGVSQDRLIYLDWTPSVWDALQAHGVDLYIASFPYGGAITLIEAMGAGVPVIMHRHMYSELMSCLELAYPEAFSWDDPGALLEHLKGLTRKRLRAEGALARQRYEDFHRPDILREYLRGHGPSLSKVPPRIAVGSGRMDEWACCATNQVSLRHVVARTIYRAARGVRARLT